MNSSSPAPLHSHGISGRNRSKTGFTLVEVTLALGIVAFGLVTVMALMPIGMGIFSKSRKQSAAQRIAETEITKIRAASWSELSGSVAGPALLGPRYYTIDGDAVKETDPWLYITQAQVSNAGAETGGALTVAELPGDTSADDYRESSLRRVQILVAYSPEQATGDAAFKDTSGVAKRGDLFSFPFLVANQRSTK